MVREKQVNDISRKLINEAAGKLQDIGATQEANEVIQLMSKYEASRFQHCLADDVIEQIVNLRFPPTPEWSDELQSRHMRHMKLAFQLDHEALNEELRIALKMVGK
jgi:hypothetical protein